MKIAYICADPGIAVFEWMKGCSIHVQEMLRAFGQLGHKVELFAINSGGTAPDDLRSIKVHQLPLPPRNLDRSEREKVLLLGNQSLRKALSQAGPFDLIYERYSLWSYAGMEFSAKTGVPGVLEVNSPLIEEQSAYRTLIAIDAANEVARTCFKRASAIYAISDEVCDCIAGVVDTTDKIRVMPNGVNPQRFPDTRRSRREYGAPFTIGFVGSLKPWHGVDRLVSAFSVVHRKYSASRLLLVGDGPERPNIQDQLAKYGLTDCAELTGAVSPAEIPELLARMDVGVAPYPELSRFYFSPMKVCEYMAAGLPVVASSVGQLRQTVTDEVNGLLCPAGDVMALAEALICLQRDPGLCTRLGKTARRDVLSQCSWKRLADRLLRESSTAQTPATANEEIVNYGASDILY